MPRETGAGPRGGILDKSTHGNKKSQMKKKGEVPMELWDLLNDRGEPTGKTMIRGEKLRLGQYHLVVHIWVADSKGRLLIQRRADHLLLMPGVWAVTGGSAVHGENSMTAARRELREELGMDVSPQELAPIGRLRRRNSFSDLWLVRRDVERENLVLQKEEVADARWVTRDELERMIREKEFHNYGRPYFDMVFQAVYGSSANEL